MALRLVEGTVLSRRPSAQGPARLLRDPVSLNRAQWRVLPHADARGRRGVARADAGEFRVCLEGLEIHHALEAAFRAVRQQPRAARGQALAFGAEGRAGAISAAAPVRAQ